MLEGDEFIDVFRSRDACTSDDECSTDLDNLAHSREVCAGAALSQLEQLISIGPRA